MSETLLANEPLVRVGFFLGVFVLMALWEFLLPRRVRNIGRRSRWPNNVAVVVINTVILRLLFPAAAVGLALVAESHNLGLLNLIQWPRWISIVLGVVFFDLVIYLQHVMFHAVPAFWRLHRMHHADLDIDVTTGVRFHPIEIVLSMLVKLGAILMLGPPAVSVLIFEVCDAGHAPGTSLGRGLRGQQQLRIQLAMVGPPFWYLSKPAESGSPRHDHRPEFFSRRAKLPQHKRHAYDSVQGQERRLRHQQA
jgi:hypothetical protein